MHWFRACPSKESFIISMAQLHWKAETVICLKTPSAIKKKRKLPPRWHLYCGILKITKLNLLQQGPLINWFHRGNHTSAFKTLLRNVNVVPLTKDGELNSRADFDLVRTLTLQVFSLKAQLNYLFMWNKVDGIWL